MSGPLIGKTVLVTRPRGQERGIIQLFTDLGAMTLHWPPIDIQPPTDWLPLDNALRNAGQYDWFIFTSANGVRMCLDRMRDLEIPLSALDTVRTAAIGPATARALRRYHLSPKLIPNDFDSAGLVAAISPDASGQRMLLIRAEQGNPKLRAELANVGQVEDVAAYQQIESEVIPTDVRTLLASGDVQVITLTSANIAQTVIKNLEAAAINHIHEQRTLIVTNSASTSQVVVESGLPVAMQAETSLDDGIVTAVVSVCGRTTTDL